MYERFTERARKVMQLANEEAQRLNHEYIGTEHLLLGLVSNGTCVAAMLLNSLDVNTRKIRAQIDRIVQPGPERAMCGKLPRTPRAVRAIEFAMEEVRSLQHEFLGTEHLLLGLLRENEGLAAQVLMNLGVTLTEVRGTLLEMLGVTVESDEASLPPRMPKGARWELLEFDRLIEKLTQEKEDTLASADVERAAQAADRVRNLKKEREALLVRWQDEIKEGAIAQKEITEIEIILPIDRPVGDAVDSERLASLTEYLRAQFGHVLVSQQKLVGRWELGGAVLEGEVTTFRVYFADDAALQRLAELRQRMKSEFPKEDTVFLLRKARSL
jgi:hypothetical protein